KNGAALIAQSLTVTYMFCDLGFHAEGAVRLPGASIGSQLSFVGAHMDGKNGPALTALGLTVTGDMLCTGGFKAEGEVSLAGAKIGKLVDDSESWPERMDLDGLTYDDLTYLYAWERLDWLKRYTGYSPQPYEQLAGYYRRLGHDEEARRVLLAKER